jgi:phage protein D
MKNNDWNYEVPMRFGENYNHITKKVEEVTLTDVIDKKADIIENKSKNNKKAARVIDKKLNIVKKNTGKYDEKLLLNMRGFKDRLRKVAKVEGKAHHTLATDVIIAEILKLEKKHLKEKYIEKQYSI